MALWFLPGVLLCAISGVAMAGDAPAAEPGVVIDHWEGADIPFLERAVASATAQGGHPLVLSVNRMGTAGEQADRLAEKRPERTVVAVTISEEMKATAAIRPAAAVKARFEAATLARIEGGIAEGMRRGRLNKSMAEAVLEVGAIAAGQKPMSRGVWNHPLQLLTGGNDVTDDERLYFLLSTIAVFAMIFYVWNRFR